MHRKAFCNGREYTIWSDGTFVTVRRQDGETSLTGTIVTTGAPFSDAVRDIKVDSGGDDVLLASGGSVDELDRSRMYFARTQCFLI